MYYFSSFNGSHSFVISFHLVLYHYALSVVLWEIECFRFNNISRFFTVLCTGLQHHYVQDLGKTERDE